MKSIENIKMNGMVGFEIVDGCFDYKSDASFADIKADAIAEAESRGWDSAEVHVSYDNGESMTAYIGVDGSVERHMFDAEGSEVSFDSIEDM